MKEQEEEKIIKAIKKTAVIAVITAFALVVMFGILVLVPAGHVGVLFDKLAGGVQLQEYNAGNEGLGFKIPYFQKVVKMDIRTQTVEYKADAAITPKDKNGINFKWDVVVRYKLDKSQAAEVYKTKGLDYADKIIGTSIRAKAREIMGEYAQEDLPENRLELSGRVREALQLRVNEEASEIKELKDNFLIIEAVDLRNLEFHPDIEVRIIEKQKRLQQAQEQEYNLQITERQREIEVVKADAIRQKMILEAEGEANAIILVAEARAIGIQKVNDAYQRMPAQYVATKFAEAIKPTDKVYLGFESLAGGNNLGVLNYNQLLGQQYAGGVNVTG